MNKHHFLLAALKRRKMMMIMTVTKAQKKIFIFEASCSYLFVSTSYLRAYCIFNRACFILSEAILSLAPIPNTNWDVSIAICFTTAIIFSISLSYWSSSSRSFFLNDSPSYFWAWICYWAYIFISRCDSRIWSSLRDVSFLSISSAENDYKNYLIFILSRSIVSEFYCISIRLFCLSIKDACYLWNSIILDLRLPRPEVIISAFRLLRRSIEA